MLSAIIQVIGGLAFIVGVINLIGGGFGGTGFMEGLLIALSGALLAVFGQMAQDLRIIRNRLLDRDAAGR